MSNSMVIVEVEKDGVEVDESIKGINCDGKNINKIKGMSSRESDYGANGKFMLVFEGGA